MSIVFQKNKNLEKDICNFFEENKTWKNLTLYFKIANVFNLASVAQANLKVIERCYTRVIETENFLQLDVDLVKKILFSSELHITSELEVFTAANDWISFNLDKRTKFSKSLLMTVRFPLLSEPALKHLLGYSICKNDECRTLVKSMLMNRKTFYQQGKNAEHRYCSQSSFEVFLSSRKRKLKQIDLGENPHNVRFGCSLEKSEKIYKAVVVRGEVYVVARKQASDGRKSLAIKKYWGVTERWETVAETGYRKNFGVCRFMNCVFIIGGMRRWGDMCTTSLRYDTKFEEMKSIRGTEVERFDMACTAFDGKVVTAGGCALQETVYAENGSVESFDHVAGTWSPMPNMTRGHFRHCLVAIKTRLFVIGECERECEVFDKQSNCFALISSSLTFSNISPDIPGAVLIGKKIAMFGRQEKTIVFYDTENDDWYEESCEKLIALTYKSCVKFPKI